MCLATLDVISFIMPQDTYSGDVAVTTDLNGWGKQVCWETLGFDFP